MRFASLCLAGTLSITAVTATAPRAFAQQQQPRPQGEVSGQVTVEGPPTVYAPPAPTTAPPVTTYAPPPPQGGTVPVYVRDDQPGMVHRIFDLSGNEVSSCTGNCTFNVYPGTYTIYVEESADARKGKKIVSVSGPTVVDVSPGSKSTRTTGLVLGIVGPVATFVGGIGLLVVAAERSVNDTTYDCTSYSGCTTNTTHNDPSYTPWAILFIGGIGATVAGWVMFGSASTKIKASPASGPPPVAFGVAPTKGGAAFGMTVHF